MMMQSRFILSDQQHGLRVVDRSGVLAPIPCERWPDAPFIVEALNLLHEKRETERQYAAENAPREAA